MLKYLTGEIAVPDEFKLGCYSNAFRVQKADTEDFCILEFLVYSAREKQASLVAQIKVPKSFLPTILQRMDETLKGLVSRDSGVY